MSNYDAISPPENEQTQLNFIENVLIDVRYAFTRFIAQPMTTMIIILTLALSIGATTAIFSVVNGLLFQATPFADSEKLVILQQQDLAQDQSYGFSASEMLDYQTQAQTFENMAEYHNMTFTMYGHGDPVRVRTGVVSSNFFNMLSISPLLGRTFTESEDDIGAEPLVLLTYEFWQSQFNGQADIIDQSVEFNNRSHKIIGVLPHFPQFPDVNDVYMAIPSCPWRGGEGAIANRSMRMMSGFAKIKLSDFLHATNSSVIRPSLSICILACAIVYFSSSIADKYSILSVTIPFINFLYGLSRNPYLFTRENVAKLLINPIFGPSGVSIGHIRP